MKQLLITILIFLSSIVLCHGQVNLVYNGSFEQYDTCPNGPGQINRAKYWFSANNGHGGSSEYFNACDNPGLLGVPDNGWTFQDSRTGTSYAGSEFYENLGNYREYIEGALTSTLKPQVSYCVSFYVSLSDSSAYGIDALGMYFTNDSLITQSGLVYQVKPQISNDSLNFIIDKNNWIKIEGNFIAIGGEKFFTIGNFKKNNQTDTIKLLPFSVGYAYYLIDDVAVYECDASVFEANAGRDTAICLGDSLRIGMPYYNEYKYSWYANSGVLIDTTNYLMVSPVRTTNYILTVENFKYDITTDTVTVTVDKDCDKEQIIYIPNIFSPNGDGKNDMLFVRGEKIMDLKFKIYDRWGNAVFETNDKSQGWDGTYKGEKCEIGVYAYMANIDFSNGQSIIKTGTISLVR
jgi:gliding motility-associated-like protein